MLFGVFALQNGLIDQGQLVAAFQAWTNDKSGSIADYLTGSGALEYDDRTAVEFLVARHLKKHGGDTEKSLAALSAAKSTRESLGRIGDADIDATLEGIGAIATDDGGAVDATVTYGVGAATSDGERFRVLRPHAKGGLGAVFVALDVELHREVALKRILDQHADNEVNRQRFLLEAEVTGGLEHPGIVPVYGLGTYPDGRPYYAMRFIRGESLKDAIAAFHGDEDLKRDLGRRSLGLRQLLRRFVDVCNAIEYAHGRGVLHRDIKPANIIVGKHGETLVVDWGLAKPLLRAEPGSAAGERTLVPSSCSGTVETMEGSAIGTPAYMSPEQACGDLESMGARSDVYSLGATLYSLLTGKPPFSGDVADALRAVQKSDFLPPRKRDPSIARGLEAACLKAMALQSENRYNSARALAEDIERWMADEPMLALREGWIARARRWSRKHRTAVAALAGLFIAATIGLAIGTVLITREWKETQVQRNIAQAQGRVAQTQRNEAEAQGRQARQAVRLLTRVAEIGFDEQLDPLQKQFLENALAYYEQFTGRGVDDPGVTLEHGLAYQQMGAIQRKLGRFGESERAFRSAARSVRTACRR